MPSNTNLLLQLASLVNNASSSDDEYVVAYDADTNKLKFVNNDVSTVLPVGKFQSVLTCTGASSYSITHGLTHSVLIPFITDFDTHDNVLLNYNFTTVTSGGGDTEYVLELTFAVPQALGKKYIVTILGV
jgi:hypothetical protein